MTTINLNLKNFLHRDILLKVFSDYAKDFGFWVKIKSNFFAPLIKICQIMRYNHASLEEIELLLAHIYPRDGDTIQNWIKNSVDFIEYPAALLRGWPTYG